MTRFLTTTGIHKSGNSWLVTMLTHWLSEQHIACNPLARYLCLHDLLNALSLVSTTEPMVTASQLAERLIAPMAANRFKEHEVPTTVISELARRIRWNQARGNRAYNELPELRAMLAEFCYSSSVEVEIPAICFLPSKHMPAKTLDRQFPSFAAIWLIRDPRDALVSYFYHDMGVLTARHLDWFVSETGGHRKYHRREDWREAFLTDRIQRQLDYYRMAFEGDRERLRTVKYESLLSDTVNELMGILDWIQVPYDPASIQRIAAKYQFSKLTGSNSEQTDSFVRKGVSEEWRTHLQQTDASHFSSEYCELLAYLGYESDSTWLDSLPVQATIPFDLCRFRLRSSAVYASMDYWLDNERIQVLFPRPFQFEGEESYFQHLLKCEDPRIREWFERVAICFDLTRELDNRNDVDQLLGY